MNLAEKAINVVALNGLFAFGHHSKKRYIAKSRKAGSCNRKFLMKQLERSKNTEYGKKYGFGDIRTVKEFQQKVPFTTYEDYQPYVERMVNNAEQGLLTGNKVDYFARTSGTIKTMKMIPVVKGTYTHYLRCASALMSNLHDELKRKYKGIPYGKGLNFIECGTEMTPGGLRSGFISGYAIGSSLAFIPHITCLPREIFGCNDPIDMKYVKARYALQDGDITYIMAVFMSAVTDLMGYIRDNSDMLVKDIEQGVIDKSVLLPDDIRHSLEKRLKPDPERAAELSAVFADKSDEGLILRLWNRMSLIIGIGTGEFAPFEKKLRKLTGPDIPFCYEMYAASEALMATTLNMEDKNYMILPDSGFFEFIPEGGSDEHPLLIDQLEKGKNYEIVVTNEAGLYRYRIKDVVKVTGFMGEAPLVQFAYRKEQIMNIAGVHMTMEHITETMNLFETAIGTRISDYSVYADNDSTPGRVVLFVETDEAVPDRIKKEMPKIFDTILSEICIEYGHSMNSTGELIGSAVYCTKKGTYKTLRDQKIKKGIAVNQIKTLRVISTKEQLSFFMNAVSAV